MFSAAVADSHWLTVNRRVDTNIARLNALHNNVVVQIWRINQAFKMTISTLLALVTRAVHVARLLLSARLPRSLR